MPTKFERTAIEVRRDLGIPLRGPYVKNEHVDFKTLVRGLQMSQNYDQDLEFALDKIGGQTPASKKRRLEISPLSAEEEAFVNGGVDELVYSPGGDGDYNRDHVMDRVLYPILANNVVNTLVMKYEFDSGTTQYRTLTLENFSDVRAAQTGSYKVEQVVQMGSDEMMDFWMASASRITIYKNLAERSGANWSRKKGAFFPYTHTYGDDNMTSVLASLGCHRGVEAANYKFNCLYLALKSAGVSHEVLNSLNTRLLRRKISRANIKSLAEEYRLCVSIRTSADKDVVRYGSSDGFKVDLALVEDHYIHLYKTDINRFALENYDLVSHLERWWEFKSTRKGCALSTQVVSTQLCRDTSRGMSSLDLLRFIASDNCTRSQKIDIATEGIFTTQFHDQFTDKVSDFPTLSVHDSDVRPMHPSRHQPDSVESIIDGVMLREASASDTENCKQIDDLVKRYQKSERGSETVELLERRIKGKGWGSEETLSALKRGEPDRAVVFYDFEACPFGEHTPYLARCSSETGEVLEFRGHNCAKQMLDHIARTYGAKSNDDSLKSEFPRVKMIAHNHTYDLSFLLPHMCRISTTERSTDIIKAKADYHCFTGEVERRPNHDLARWMRDEGCKYWRARPETWATATKHIRKHTEQFIDSAEKVKDVHGVGPVVAHVLDAFAPWDEFDSSRSWNVTKSTSLVFQDSYKMISMPLRSFGDSFNLSQEKEVMAHELYTQDFVFNRHGVATEPQVRKHITGIKDWLKMKHNLAEWGCVLEDGRLDMIKYSSEYCKRDVEVLAAGFECFRQSLIRQLSMDCLHFPTISSLADSYLAGVGCFDGVCEVRGILQKFIARCCVGGRVCTARGEKIKYDAHDNPYDWLDDFDAVSLYPSAMRRIIGYLKGAPQLWQSGDDLSAMDGYFLQIRIDRVGNTEGYTIPVTCVRKEDGGNDWTNDLVGKELFVDKTALEDLERWMQIEYTIVQGVTFSSGRNPQIKDSIKHLFDMRLALKDQKNPAQICIKLLMNAGYGITGLKAPEADVKYVPSGEPASNFVQNHANEIKSFTQLPNEHQWRFELYKEIDSHFNRQHCSCEILSMSKRIVNEVTCLADEVERGCVHYSDTDSMHIRRGALAKLQSAFKHRYGRELVGKSMGQFHCDFDIGGCFETVDGVYKRVSGDRKEKHLAAKRSIFLGKKSYLDVLVDEKTGAEAVHMRMKGIPVGCLVHKINEEFDGDAEALYSDLYEGRKIDFDLSNGSVCFRTGKDHQIRTVEMSRSVCF